MTSDSLLTEKRGRKSYMSEERANLNLQKMSSINFMNIWLKGCIFLTRILQPSTLTPIRLCALGWGGGQKEQMYTVFFWGQKAPLAHATGKQHWCNYHMEAKHTEFLSVIWLLSHFLKSHFFSKTLISGKYKPNWHYKNVNLQWTELHTWLYQNCSELLQQQHTDATHFGTLD